MAALDVATAARLTVVRPGEGRVGGLAPGVGVIFKIDGADSGGTLSIVLEGEIGFRSNDQEVVLGPGGYIVKPRGEVHAMWNAGATPARMIEVISPAGCEGFFRELSDMTAVGAPDPADIASLGERYQLPFAQPDWLPDVIARYGLTPLTR